MKANISIKQHFGWVDAPAVTLVCVVVVVAHVAVIVTTSAAAAPYANYRNLDGCAHMAKCLAEPNKYICICRFIYVCMYICMYIN